MAGSRLKTGLLVAAVLVVALGCRNNLLERIREDVEQATYVGTPKLLVTQGTTTIASGGSYPLFPGVATNASDWRTFRIQNDGDEELVLTGPVAVSLLGDTEFRIDPNAGLNYAPHASSEFILFFDPDSVGGYSANLTIQSNDPDQAVFTFTVTGTGTSDDNTQPQINSKSPATGATLVPIQSNIVVTFSEPMGAIVASDAIFYLYVGPPTEPPGSKLAAIYGRDEDGDVVTLDPTANLQPNTQYTAEVHPDAMDLAGNKLLGTNRWSFTTLPPPGAPVLSVPANNAVDQQLSLTLNWSDASNAESYEVFWNTSGSFGSTPNATVSGSPPASQYALSGLDRATKYYWMVKAVNSSGKTSCASTYNFTTIPNAPAKPTLSAPADGTGVLTSPANLSWNTASGATSYNVYCDTNSAPTTLKITAPSTSYAMATSPGNRYYWKVGAVNAGGETLSSIWSFFTYSPPATAPTLSTPANAATGQSLFVKFSWSAVGEATSYDLYLSTSNPPKTVYRNVTTTSYTPTSPLGYTTYYWKVVPKNDAGDGPESSVRSFTTHTNTLYPPDGSTGIPRTPIECDWAPRTGATSYIIYVKQGAGPFGPLEVTTEHYFDTNPAHALAGSTQYTWYVQAMTKTGVLFTYPTCTFTTAP